MSCWTAGYSLVFTAEDSRGILLDCLAARLVEFAPPNTAQLELFISIAGACISHQIPGAAEAIVVRLAGGLDGATMLQEMARVQLPNAASRIAMCERGQSYLLFDEGACTLQMLDVATHRPKRAFTLREFKQHCCVQMLTRCSRCSCRH